MQKCQWHDQNKKNQEKKKGEKQTIFKIQEKKPTNL